MLVRGSCYCPLCSFLIVVTDKVRCYMLLFLLVFVFLLLFVTVRVLCSCSCYWSCSLFCVVRVVAIVLDGVRAVCSLFAVLLSFVVFVLVML